ncbi:MAG: tRNA-intron lyase, partial [Candidatus Nanohaloarchaea archaeon]
MELKVTTSGAYLKGEKEELEEVHSEAYYGKLNEEKLELSPSEATHLLERDLIDVEQEFEELYDYYSDHDTEFQEKYVAYSDLRERGLIVKTGFKFGAHFRVYSRGVNPYKEEKGRKDHTEFIVHAVRENQDMSFQEMSRAVRLANNIRADMMWAVVDSEKDVTY